MKKRILGILLCLGSAVAVDAVPVLTAGDGHTADGEILVQLVKGRGKTASARGGDRRTHLHGHIKGRGIEKTVEQGYER